VLKSFERWSWLKPFARRLLRKHGRTVLIELIGKLDQKLPQAVQAELEKLASNGLGSEDIARIRNIQAALSLINTPATRKASNTMDKIIALLS
jgi:hypothetical protein